MRWWIWSVLVGIIGIGGVLSCRQFWMSSVQSHMLAQAASPQSADSHNDRHETLTMTIVGDIMLAAGVGRVASAKGTEYLFADVKQSLLRDDLTIGNLECAVATGGSPQDKQFTFRAHPALLSGLRKSGVDAVSLANNHTLDYQQSALLETIDLLQRVGIAYAGAGRDLQGASKPAMLPMRNQVVAFIAASRVLPTVSWYATPAHPGIAQAYRPERLLREIRAAAPVADTVVVYFHWGKERAIFPEKYQRALARQCIDAGADLVVGTHPHVLQGFEYYRGKLIAYSLGNFVFTDRNKTTAMLHVAFRKGEMQRATVIPCVISHFRPRVIRDSLRQRQILRALQARSYGVTISAGGVIAEATKRNTIP